MGALLKEKKNMKLQKFSEIHKFRVNILGTFHNFGNSPFKWQALLGKFTSAQENLAKRPEDSGPVLSQLQKC